jgi:O-antigen/teichoic acid export membrane protein
VTAKDDGGAVRARLASGFLMIKNTAITAGAFAVIALMGLIAVPLLIDRLGAARFGILTLTWVVIGYASALDLGLGRALTKLTADRLGAGRPEEVPGLFWTALTMLGAIGVTTGGIIVAASGFLTNDVLSIEPGLTGETQRTFVLLGFSVPFVLLSTAAVGNLEAHQRFDLTNGIALPLSFLSYFGPVAIALFTTDLPVVVSAVCLSRVAATGIYLFACLRVSPNLRTHREVSRRLVSPLIRYGGWVTVASVTVGVMLTLDRFLIGAIVSASAVAFYATPYEGSKQMLLVSTALAAVLFPGFAANVGRDDARVQTLFSRGVRATFVSLFPLVLFAATLAYEILDTWINAEFAQHGTPVLKFLSLGLLVNGLAFVAFALIQSTRPDVIAKVALVELPLYLGLVWLMVRVDGIEGAAIAFALRAAADTTVLYYFTRRLGLVSGSVLLQSGRLAVTGLAVVAIGAVLPSTPIRLTYVVVVIACFLPLAWSRILSEDERIRLREKLVELRASSRTRLKRSAPDVA